MLPTCIAIPARGRPVIFTIAFLLSSVCAASAQTDTTRHASDAWLVYNGKHELSSQWSLLLEGQLRRTQFVSEPRQFLARAGLQHEWTRSLSTGTGYTFFRTSPASLLAEPIPVSEHRTFEQVQLSEERGAFAFQQRLRLEQRWEQHVEMDASGPRTNGRDYENRIRLQMRASCALHHGSLSDIGAYASVTEEPFLRWGPDVQRTFDQNRAFAGLGYRWSKAWRAEAGYLNQYRRSNEGRKIALDHALQLTLFSEVKLR